MRYEALKPDHSAPQRTPVTESSKGTDVSTFIYDDKGRKKDSLRAHDIHVAPDPRMDAKYEIERARNDERQLEGWRSWQDEQTRAQAAYTAGTYYTPAYAPPQYPGASAQTVPYNSGTQASGYQTHNTNRNTYNGKSNRGKNNPQNNQRNSNRENVRRVPRVTAANGTDITILGQVRLGFSVQQLEMSADLLVAENVDELILGYDWLRLQGVNWNFQDRQLILHSATIPLTNGPARFTLRRVYIQQLVSIPPHTKQNLPVKVEHNSLNTPIADWMINSIQISKNVYAARVLISRD